MDEFDIESEEGGVAGFRVLVFDFDGTIANTMEHALAVFNDLAGEYGLRRMDAADVHHAKHMSLRELVRFIGVPAWRLPALVTRGKRMLTQRMGGIAPIEGMPEVLRALAARVGRLGIVTSNSVENVNTFLRSHDLDCFQFICSAGSLTGKAKYLRKINLEYTCGRGDLLYVGDEIRDIEAAHDAGLPVAAVTWGFNSAAALEAALPDYLLHEPWQLLDLAGSGFESTSRDDGLDSG